MRNTDQLVFITTSIILVVIPRRWLAGIARTRTTTAEHAEARAVRTRLAGRQLRSSLARLHADGAAVAALSAAAAAAGMPGCRGAGRWVGDKGQRVNFPSWAGRLVIPMPLPRPQPAPHHYHFVGDTHLRLTDGSSSSFARPLLGAAEGPRWALSFQPRHGIYWGIREDSTYMHAGSGQRGMDGWDCAGGKIIRAKGQREGRGRRVRGCACPSIFVFCFFHSES